MNKKAYISPAALPYGMETEGCLLEGSLTISDTQVDEADGGWVKSEGRTYHNTIDWDDDWSN